MSKVGYNFTVSVTKAATFAISNFELPVYNGGFKRDEFWEEFSDMHPCDDEDTLITLLLDLTRCHYSPKVENWPGMVVSVDKDGSGSMDIDLPVGRTRVKAFVRGKGKIYSWTRACLATAGIFEQVFRQSGSCQTDKINGNWNGATQFMSTVDGFTDKDYRNTVKAFKTWLGSVGIAPRAAEVDAAISSSTVLAIASRTKKSSAFSFVNAIRFLTGDDPVEADQVSFKA